MPPLHTTIRPGRGEAPAARPPDGADVRSARPKPRKTTSSNADRLTADDRAGMRARRAAALTAGGVPVYVHTDDDERAARVRIALCEALASVPCAALGIREFDVHLTTPAPNE